MENEIQVGEFIRTKDGRIYQVDSSNDEWALSDIFYKVIVKHSPNLIDIIEEGEYVNGYKVLYVCNEEPCPSGKYVDIDCNKPSEQSYIFDNQIKTIVTKEMMESISYKVTKM